MSVTLKKRQNSSDPTAQKTLRRFWVKPSTSETSNLYERTSKIVLDSPHEERRH